MNMFHFFSYTIPLMLIPFIMSSHPITMGISIMFMTLITCLISGILHSSFLMSYILFLIYLGAMLILFIYISSLAPNELFFSYPSTQMNIFLTSILFIYPYFTISTPMHISTYNQMQKLFSISMFPISLLLILFLLITLLSVNRLLTSQKTPLKMFN